MKTEIDITTIYTPSQTAVVNDLQLLQTKLGLSDAAFTRKHLSIHASNWLRIKVGSYGAADPSAALLKLEGNLRQLRIEMAQAAKLTGGTKWTRIPWQETVMTAVTLAKLKPDEDCERLVVALAETGGGKTRLARQIKLEHDGILVEASEPWRTSYYAAVYDVALAAGVPEKDLGNSKHSVQRALINKLRQQRRVLIIDEAEYFGPAATNLIKLILNLTPTVILVVAIPDLFARWQRSAWVESSQTTRRSEAVVLAEKVFPEDVVELAKNRGSSINAAAAGVIAKAANEFGRISFVLRTLNDLGDCTSAADAEQAVCNVKALLRRAA